MYLSDLASLYPILFSVLVIFIPVMILLVIVLIKFIGKNIRKSKEYNKATQFDYESLFGGSDNIISIEVKLSRVSILVKDLDAVNLEALKEKNMGVLVSGNLVKCSSPEFAQYINDKTNGN